MNDYEKAAMKSTVKLNSDQMDAIRKGSVTMIDGVGPLGNTYETVDHPAHYCSHPSKIECIAITEHMNFCLGNAVKYIWRSGEKGNAIEDLRKSIWYINREIERLKNAK